MSLEPLATLDDLQDRGVDVADTTLTDAMLSVASASVREAAGAPILERESTVVLYAWGDTMLHLPGQPVTVVDSVEVDGAVVTDYTFVGTALWCASGWGSFNRPAQVEVTLTHGLVEVPADIVDLVCNLAAAGMAEARSMAAGGSFDPRIVVESVDDYRVQWAEGAEAFASVMDLPNGTRSRLRSRFGGGADVVEYR